MLNIRLEIGLPEGGKWLNTAFVNQQYREYISSNQVSFWCYLPDYGIEVKIAKQTPEGQRILKAIKDKVPPHYMESILLSIVFPALSVTQLRDILADQYDRGFKAGKNAIRETFACLMTPE